MRYMSATLSALLLSGAVLTATAAPTSAPATPNPNPPPVPHQQMNNPPISHPPGDTTRCPPSAAHSPTPGASTAYRTPATPAPGAATGMPPC